MEKIFSKKSLLGASVGTMIEHYDYGLFVFFLPVFAPVFFTAKTKYDALSKVYIVLLFAMLARPLGGLFFGHLGDRLGRKKAMLASMGGIAIGTSLIGVIPGHDRIGIWAVVLVTLAKTIQLFCFGGEYNSAGTYVVEHALQRHEGFIGGMLSAVTLFGALLASLTGVLATSDGFPDWAWRVAFLFGGLAGFFGILYRKNLQESPVFEPAKIGEHRLSHIFTRYLRQTMAGIFIGGFCTLPATTILTFINPVLMTTGYFTKQQFMWLQSFLIVVAVISLLVTGMAADKKTPVKIMKWGALSLIFLAFPLLFAMDSGNIFLVVSAQASLIFINEMMLGPANAFLKNAFPVQYRCRAISFSFCLGMSIVGGVTPVIESYLYKLTQGFSIISLWHILFGLLTYASLKRAHDEIRTCFQVVGL